MYYNYFRDYDPGIGRYIEADPIGLSGGPNVYVYALSAPLRFRDKNGLMSDQQCCQLSIGKGQDEGDTGWPVCCDGKKVACTNVNNNDWNSPQAASLVRKCAADHEREHFPILKPCNCSMRGVIRLDARDDIDVKSAECTANANTLKCLDKAIKQCGNDAVCISDLKGGRDSVRKRKSDYCLEALTR